jgi:O-antigen ligase
MRRPRSLIQWLDGWRVLMVLLLVSFTVAATESAAAVPHLARFGLGVLLLAYTLLRHPPRRFMRRRQARMIARLALFFVFAIASLAWTEHRSVVFEQVLGAVVLIGIPVVTSLGRWRNLERLRGDLGVIFAVLAAGSVAGVVSPTFVGIQGRFAGLYANPNTYAMITALAIALGLGVMRTTRYRLIMIITMAVLTIGLVWSQGRTSILALAAGALLLFVRHAAWRRRMLLAGVGVIFAGASAALFQVDIQAPAIFDRLSSSEGDLLSNRGIAWAAAGQLWAERPLEGHGFRSGGAVFEEARSRGVLTGFSQSEAHNGFIQVLMESGLVGMTLLVLALAPVVATRRPRRQAPSDLWIGPYVAVLVGLVTQVGESSIFGVGSPFMLVFWTCAVAAVTVAAADAQVCSGMPSGSKEASSRRSTSLSSTSRPTRVQSHSGTVNGSLIRTPSP